MESATAAMSDRAITRLDDSTNQPFEYDLNPAIDGALSPPVILGLAQKIYAPHNGSVIPTKCLLRGSPDVTRAGTESHSLNFTPEEREYAPTAGHSETLDLLSNYLEAYQGMPPGFEITLTHGGRPALALIDDMFGPETAFLMPSIAYSAVPAMTNLRDRRCETVNIDLNNFDVEKYQNDILTKAAELKQAGVKGLVFMETLPGNPLGITYPEKTRVQFLDKLQAMGIVVVMDTFYSTYVDPDSDNYPYNPFRGLKDMKGRLSIGGITKDGPYPDPGSIRMAWLAGDPTLIKGALSVQATIEGGNASASQIILARRLRQAFDQHGNAADQYLDEMEQFSRDTAAVRSMTKAQLNELGFYIFGEDESGLSLSGLYIFAEAPDNKPNFVGGFSNWAKPGALPGLPLSTFITDPRQRPRLEHFQRGTRERFPLQDLVRVCIGAGRTKVSAALGELSQRIGLIQKDTN